MSEQGETRDGSGEGSGHGNGDERRAAGEERRHFRWELLVVFMCGLLLLLGVQLWRRLDRVDPLQRCVGAYEGVRTAVDSGLVDRIAVRWPDRETRTTCGALREDGVLARVPRRQPTGGGILPPPPR